MRYIIEQGQNKRVFVLLHGTGGDARNLFGLASYMDPDATRIGMEGEVVEHGMRRFFERNPDGSFVEESLLQATDDLHESIGRALEEVGAKPEQVVLAGYSNGANIALSLLKSYGTNYAGALLFHPSVTRPGEAYQAHPNLKLLVTSGKGDPYITAEAFDQVLAEMKSASLDVEAFVHEQGHSLIEPELQAAQALLARMDEG